MKTIVTLFTLCILFSSGVAHSGHNHSETVQDPVSDAEIDSSQSSFSQLYPEYRSGTIWVVAEILVVLGATGLAVRHYFRKSESSSLKEFIREEVL